MKPLSEAFERITINQMLTLVDLHDHPFPHEVAKIRNQDLSSIRKQLATLNSTFIELCGEKLLDLDVGRAKPVQFTQTGEDVVNLINRFLEESYSAVDRRRHQVGRKLTAASTTGMLPVISKLWPLWQARARGQFDLHVSQIRTAELSSYLSQGKVDIVFAGMIDQKSSKNAFQEFEFLRWSKGHRVVLLTNDPTISTNTVKLGAILSGKIAMILASHGIMKQFAELAFRDDINRINLVATVDDLGFGVGLLRNNIYHASILTIESIADSEIRKQTASVGTQIRKVEVKGLEELTIMDGVFRRRISTQFSPKHPINICWEVIKEQVDRTE